jgi:dolichol-phosphate mannosyltransferase
MKDTLYIVMPAYNEAENIGSTIKQWYPIVNKIGGDSRLLIVDDGSKDDTYAIMSELQKDFPLFIPITKVNSGHGATCIYAYNYAISNGADYIFQTDSDGQTSPDEFWEFWNNRLTYDFVIGTRSKRQDGKDRVFVTKVLKFIVFLVFGVVVDDCNTPFRLMKASKLAEILKLMPADFFLSNVIVSTVAVKRREKIKWIPITFKPRQGGENSINFKKIVKIGFKAISDFKLIRRNLI